MKIDEIFIAVVATLGPLVALVIVVIAVSALCCGGPKVTKNERLPLNFDARWWHFETDEGWKNQTKTGG